MNFTLKEINTFEGVFEGSDVARAQVPSGKRGRFVQSKEVLIVNDRFFAIGKLRSCYQTRAP